MNGSMPDKLESKRTGRQSTDELTDVWLGERKSRRAAESGNQTNEKRMKGKGMPTTPSTPLTGPPYRKADAGGHGAGWPRYVVAH